MRKPLPLPGPDPATPRVARLLNARRPLRSFLSGLSRAVSERGGVAWLVGGTVRDLVEGKPGNDIDLMTTGIGFEELGNVLRGLPASRLGILRIIAAGKHFPVYKIRTRWTAEDVDVSPARAGRGVRGRASRGMSGPADHLAEAGDDAGRRDLTINALAVRLLPGVNRVRAELFDFCGGLEDLRRRTVRAVSDPKARLKEDPLRILRCIRQKNERPGWSIDPRTWSALVRIAPKRLPGVPADRVAVELLGALAADPAGTLDDLRRSAILPLLVPEWKELPVQALARTKRRFAFVRRAFGAPLPAALLGATLLVDLAEAEWRARAAGTEPSRGLPRTAAAVRRLRLPQVRRVLRLLEDLARLTNLRRLDNPDAQVEAIFRRWRNADGMDALYRATQRAAGRRTRDFRATLKCAARRPPLVSGDDLAAAGVPRGPAFGEILEAVRDATIAGRIKGREDALSLAVSLARPVSPGARRRRGGSRGRPSRSSARRT